VLLCNIYFEITISDLLELREGLRAFFQLVLKRLHERPSLFDDGFVLVKVLSKNGVQGEFKVPVNVFRNAC
jgi:hypothetical protein